MSGNWNSILKQVFRNVRKSETCFNPNIASSVNSKQFSVQAVKKRTVLKIGVQGAGFDRGQRKPGVEKGPATIRSSGFIDFLRDEVGHDVVDYGDLNFGLETRKCLDTSSGSKPGDLRNTVEVGKANLTISNSTSKIVRDGRIPITLGGDHSIAIGTIHGVSEVIQEPLAVLWVDAHTDINTPGTTDSGNLHGMSLSFLLKELKAQPLPEFSWVIPRISAAHLAYIGLRSVDSGEREILDRLGITTFSMRDVDRLGIVEVTRRALDKICPTGSQRPLHVSFDIDALDDSELGGADGGAVTGTAVEGGLTIREGMTLLEEVHDLANVVSMDLVEVNPDLGNVQAQTRTAALSKHLFGSLFGYCRGGMSRSK